MKITITAVLFALVAQLGCGKKADDAKPAGASGSAPAAPGSGSATVKAPDPVGSGSGSGSGSAAPGDILVLPELSGDLVMVLAPTAGGTVPMKTADGKTEQLANRSIAKTEKPPDGLKAPTDPNDDDFLFVSAGSKKGFVKHRSLVESEPYESNISPDKKSVIVMAQISCGDFCHSDVWLLSGAKQWKVAEAVDPRVAWNSKRAEVAIYGDGEMFVVDVATGKQLAKTDKLLSPSYSPDGVLHARDRAGGVFTFIDGKAKKIGKGKKPAKPSEEGEEPEGPDPVEFKPDGTWKLPKDG